ncbi:MULTISPECIES: ArsR/SmtB family transcription factor [Achromobacter]|uniref:Metalloregulator ArsR/SmtB family transcription factor n=1 Tax=Achromobacter spanius TaxID=217203 RepID=A0ABY8GZ45_9BURK|nr:MULTISPECIES: metalloregulator ArsR/SmtB family transcription factor [Achromobacter]WAI86159.1 metalloregulator ArsR/SmtB family transcription factor [Achromobacter spanius]WEX96240.1 metalloregulator ArsR/SmtB family transcription factor [Achromobacter sp. SS2-2022]WFP10042.1 metalloregulator ArsR/SmtB family transcription factor [Achromobacter spanius]
MVNLNNDTLDSVFSALADGTRRRVLADLEQGTATVSELARPHAMSLPAFLKHLRVLEDAGLIARAKDGRVVSCTLSPEPMQAASDWLARYEKFWTGQLDSLARYLYHDEEIHPCPPPPATTAPPTPPPATPPSSSGLPDASPPPPTGSGARGPTCKR